MEILLDEEQAEHFLSGMGALPRYHWRRWMLKQKMVRLSVVLAELHGNDDWIRVRANQSNAGDDRRRLVNGGVYFVVSGVRQIAQRDRRCAQQSP